MTAEMRIQKNTLSCELKISFRSHLAWSEESTVNYNEISEKTGVKSNDDTAPPQVQELGYQIPVEVEVEVHECFVACSYRRSNWMFLSYCVFYF